jgi:hypothetical protein
MLPLAAKKDMYLKVINRFADMMQAHLSAAGDFDGPLNARFKAILSAAIDLYTGKTPVSASRFGCLAISTLPAETTQDSEFVDALNKVMSRMDRGFARLIETGSKNRFDDRRSRSDWPAVCGHASRYLSSCTRGREHKVPESTGRKHGRPALA